MTTGDFDVTCKEEYLLQRLREAGTSTFEDLTNLAGLDWATAFSAVDRLNRAGVVTLKRCGTDYLVALEDSV